MRVLVSGSSGFIGSRLVARLRAAGHDVVRLVRTAPAAGEPAILWQPASGRLDPAALSGVDAAVNLAGENLMAGRWSAERKTAIRDSRVLTTRLLASALADAEPRPRVLINASAVGIYGDCGAEPLDETSPAADRGFLAGVCRDWEAATEPAARAGVRVVLARFGVVLDPSGGALAKMLPLFRGGMGGPVGGGRQYVSWIALDDLAAALEFFLARGDLAGPFNLVAPNPLTQAEFAVDLGRALRRPAVVHTPAFAVKLALGEVAGETVLAGARVFPRRLLEAGFEFRAPDLETAFEMFFPRQAD